MQVFTGIKELVTLSGVAVKGARHVQESDLSLVRDGAILENGGRILWAGEKKYLKKVLNEFSVKKLKETNLKAECVIPALTECHTHLTYAGDRQHEFEQRNQGATYADIAKKGGGIRYTVGLTRKTKPAELLKLAEARAKEFLRQGATTVEVKSGYGLSHADELKLLGVAKKIRSTKIVSTYMGPHAIPEGRTAEEYLQEMIEKTLPQVKKQKLAERVDMFIENGYFSVEQAQKYYAAALALGFRITGHAEQLTRLGGGRLLADLSADSADHLVQINEEDIHRFSKSKTTCVLLPTSDFYLKMKYPPARALIDAGACVAIATDFNPGTAPSQDVSFVGVLARLEMKMTLPETLTAYTLGSAHALNRHNTSGSIEMGKDCDFVVLKDSWRNLFYQVGYHPVSIVVRDGSIAYKS